MKSGSSKNNMGYNKGLNAMNFLAVFLMAISIAYGAFYYCYFMDAISIVTDKDEEKSDKVNKDNIKKSCDGSIKYAVSEEAKLYDYIELDKKKAADIYNSIDIAKLEKTQEFGFIPFVEVTVCDMTVKFYQDVDLVIYQDEYYTLGENDNDFTSLISDIISSTKNVSLYSLEESYIYPLNDDVNDKIRGYVNDIDTKVTNVDLAILRKYLLVVDDKNIYFDSFNGYAEYNGNIVLLDKELFQLLSSYMVKKSDSDECCSCCPDLKPGESCIAMCCSCEYEFIE